jgi:hypothetical protein
MTLSVRILGTEIFAVSWGPECSQDALEDWNGSTHTNGTFERDTEPLRADRMEPYYEDGKRIGFQ